MISTLTITPDTNIDYEAMRVINEKEISKQSFTDMEWIQVYDLKEHKEQTIKVIDVSLYTNLLIVNGERYKILHLFAK